MLHKEREVSRKLNKGNRRKISKERQNKFITGI